MDQDYLENTLAEDMFGFSSDIENDFDTSDLMDILEPDYLENSILIDDEGALETGDIFGADEEAEEAVVEQASAVEEGIDASLKERSEAKRQPKARSQGAEQAPQRGSSRRETSRQPETPPEARAARRRNRGDDEPESLSALSTGGAPPRHRDRLPQDEPDEREAQRRAPQDEPDANKEQEPEEDLYGGGLEALSAEDLEKDLGEVPDERAASRQDASSKTRKRRFDRYSAEAKKENQGYALRSSARETAPERDATSARDTTSARDATSARDTAPQRDRAQDRAPERTRRERRTSTPAETSRTRREPAQQAPAQQTPTQQTPTQQAPAQQTPARKEAAPVAAKATVSTSQLRRYFDATPMLEASEKLQQVLKLPEIPAVIFLGRAAERCLEQLPNHRLVTIAELNDEGFVPVWDVPQQESFRRVLMAKNEATHSGETDLMVSDISELELDEISLPLEGTHLLLTRLAPDPNNPERIQGTLTLIGQMGLRSGASFLKQMKEHLEAPITLMV